MITVKLEMNASASKNTTSRNTVLELRGTQKPNETVLVSGHIDAWDVGEGAMDDGGESEGVVKLLDSARNVCLPPFTICEEVNFFL